MMDRGVSDWYENMFEMFSQEGWRQYIQDTEERLKVLRNNLEMERDPVQMHMIQGRIAELKAMMYMEQNLRDTYEQITDDHAVVV